MHNLCFLVCLGLLFLQLGCKKPSDLNYGYQGEINQPQVPIDDSRVSVNEPQGPIYQPNDINNNSVASNNLNRRRNISGLDRPTWKVPNNDQYSHYNLKRIGRKDVYGSVNTGQYSFIALTFDDGPHPIHTPRLLNILRSRGVKATFYVVGTRVRDFRSIARRIVEEGHEIGNHTYDHPDLKRLSEDQVRFQMAKCRDLIREHTGVDPLTMRPPFGSLGAYRRSLIRNEFGYPSIRWSIDPIDYKKPGVSVIINRIVPNVRNGSIILLHDLHEGSVSAVPSIIDQLHLKGFQFVTISQLISSEI